MKKGDNSRLSAKKSRIVIPTSSTTLRAGFGRNLNSSESFISPDFSLMLEMTEQSLLWFSFNEATSNG